MSESDEEYEDALKGVFKKGKKDVCFRIDGKTVDECGIEWVNGGPLRDAIPKKNILDQVTVIEPEVNPRYARDAARLEEYAAQGMTMGEALFAYCQENRKQRGEE